MKSFFPTALFLFLYSLGLSQDTGKTIAQMKNKDPEIRRAAAKSLGTTEGKDSAVVQALIFGLKDSDVYVRKFSAQSLGSMKGNAGDAVPALASLLNTASEKKENQQAAANALGKIGTPALEALHIAMKDTTKPSAVREKIIEALGGMGKAGKTAVPELIEALKSNDLRFSAAVALGKIGPEAYEAKESLTAIVENKKERDKAFREASQVALKKIQAKK